MKTEVWLPIPGYKNYEASSFGRIRSVDRVVHQLSPSGNPMERRLKGKEISPRSHPGGYKTVCLCINGKPHQHLIHRLVLVTFRGPPGAGMQACHNNGVQSDNRISNLRWGTASENMADKIQHGTWNGGRKNPQYKFPDGLVSDIREGRITADRAKKLGVSATHYRNIRTGARRSGVPGGAQNNIDTHQARVRYGHEVAA